MKTNIARKLLATVIICCTFMGFLPPSALPEETMRPALQNVASVFSESVSEQTAEDKSHLQASRKDVSREKTSKAIIVAGGDSGEWNNLYGSIQLCANSAYRSLINQGYTEDNIYYLSYSNASDDGISMRAGSFGYGTLYVLIQPASTWVYVALDGSTMQNLGYGYYSIVTSVGWHNLHVSGISRWIYLGWGNTWVSLYYRRNLTRNSLLEDNFSKKIDAISTISNLEYAIKTWAKDADDLLVYMVGHGGEGTFRMNSTELLQAGDLDNWLDEAQESISGTLSIIYDASGSGSFVPLLTSPEKERIIISSCSADEKSFFALDGTLSFSYLFWYGILSGNTVADSTAYAEQNINSVYRQTPQIDANSDGIANEDEDRELLRSFQIGTGGISDSNIPVVGNVSPFQMVATETPVLIYAENVTASEGIGRVWAAIFTPEYYETLQSETPTEEPPTVELTSVGNNRYEARSNIFNTPGIYNIFIYASDINNNPSLPKITAVKVVPRTPKAIIVAGGGPGDWNNLWDATQICANYAYRALTYQGYTKDTIYYLSHDTDLDLDGNGVLDDVDAAATNADLKTAVTEWAKDAGSLFIYMVDHGGEGRFRMGATELLYATEFDAWLDELQSVIPGNLVLVYDACRSGSFLSRLTPPPGKQRIFVSSAASDQEAIFATQGKTSFSFMFWASIFNGDSFYESFRDAKKSVSLTYRQTPQIDANGNGIADEEADQIIARSLSIGNETKSAGDLPFIGSVSDVRTLTGETSALIYAENVIDADGISRVWAVITPPDYSPGPPGTPVTDLPVLDLKTVGNDRYEAIYDGFDRPGDYNIAVFASDRKSVMGLPEQTTFTQSKGTASGRRLAADFGDMGLYLCDESSCVGITGWNPERIISWNSRLAADFGSNGLYLYDGNSWTGITGWDAENVTAWENRLAADFGSNGLYVYDGSSWTGVTGWDTENVTAWGDRLAADFGKNGLYLYDDSSWAGITGWDPENMTAWGNRLAVDFGKKGLYLYDGNSWTGVTGWDAENMTAWGNRLAADFGDRGIYVYDGASWTGITGWNPENTVAWGNRLAADFGEKGLYVYDGASWRNTAGWDADRIMTWDDRLAADFGIHGIWVSDGASWTGLTAWNPDDMEGGF